MSVPGSASCTYCGGKTFSSKDNLKKHIKNVHGEALAVEPPADADTVYKCHDCQISLTSDANLRTHLETQHEFNSDIQELVFTTYNAFTEWLQEEERENNVQYHRSTGIKRSQVLGKNVEKIYLHCVRSGNYKNPKLTNRIRKEKIQGSCKINAYCTSRMIISHREETHKWTVKYFKTHYGHEHEIQHLRIAKPDKLSIAYKLGLGIPTQSVLASLRGNVHEDSLKRLDLITRKDISNIKRRYNIDKDGCLQADDSTSAHMWVEACLADQDTNDQDPNNQDTNDVDTKSHDTNDHDTNSYDSNYQDTKSVVFYKGEDHISNQINETSIDNDISEDKSALVHELTLKKEGTSKLIEEIEKTALQIIHIVKSQSNSISKERLSLTLKYINAASVTLSSTASSSHFDATERSLEPPNKKIKKRDAYSIKKKRSKNRNIEKPNDEDNFVIIVQQTSTPVL